MPEPLATASYPGIEIAYFEKPYRFYTVNDCESVSVSTALGILAKPALTGWAANTTADGIWILARKDGYHGMPDGMHVPNGARAYVLPPRVTADPRNGKWLYKWKDVEIAAKADPDSLIRLPKNSTTLPGSRIVRGQIRQLHLDHNSTKDEAAGRGVDVHQVWQDWNESQKIPNVSEYPANRHGYIRGLARFIMEHSPEAVETEQMVGSAVHGFAGRLDTVVVLGLGGERSMIDLKTSKGVYPNTHYPQLAGYELARRECGLEPTTRQGILRVGADGEYQLGQSTSGKLDDPKAWSDAEPEDFLAVLTAYKSQQRWARKKRRS